MKNDDQQPIPVTPPVDSSLLQRPGSHTSEGLMKTEPMALATGDRATTSVPLAPEASAYGSGKTMFSSDQPSGAVAGQRVAIIGRLGGMNRREAMQSIRDHGGTPIERGLKDADIVVIGGDQLAVDVSRLMAHEGIDEALDARQIEVLAENEFYQRLGLVEPQGHVKQLYTPAMLSDLLKVSIRTVRRWHRMGLIKPVRTVHRLAYFDFHEVQSARQLAQWVEEGAKPTAIQKQLADFAKWLPGGARSVDQLNIIVEGQRLLLRQGEGLVDAAGQIRIDFESLEPDYVSPNQLDEHGNGENRQLLLFTPNTQSAVVSPASSMTAEEMLEHANTLEDEGQLREAIEWYRLLLGSFGPSAEYNFQLAELLYREGEVEAARERYYAAIELDNEYVEARANLGCVLQETGRSDLAIAAFRGAISLYPEYADVHYHLARLLDETDHRSEALSHWSEFARLSPQSPWVGEAIERLNEDTSY
jgi:tetratricopeptide (TPR) repeat protein